MFDGLTEKLFKEQINDKGRLLFFTRDEKGIPMALIDWKLEDIDKEFTGGWLTPYTTIPFLYR